MQATQALWFEQFLFLLGPSAFKPKNNSSPLRKVRAFNQQASRRKPTSSPSSDGDRPPR